MDDRPGSRDAASRPAGRPVLPGLLPRVTALDEDEWRSRHRIVVAVLAAHLPGLLLFALARHDLRVGTPLALLPPATCLALALAPVRRLVRALAAALGLMMSSVFLVALSHGLVEAHFHYFVVVAVVAVYQEWLVYLVAIAFVLVQNGLMAGLDPAKLYGAHHHGVGGWGFAAIHAGFVLALSLAQLCFWRFNEQARARERSAEGARAGSERRARQILDDSPIAVSRLDLDGVFLEVNPAYCALLGRTADQLVGHRFTEFYPPEDGPPALTGMRALLERGGRHTQQERRYLRPDRSVAWGLVSVSVLGDDDGRPVEMLSQAQDITGRRNAGDTRLALALSAAGLLSWDWDLTTGIFTRGKGDSALVGDGPWDAESLARVHPDDRAAVQAAQRKALYGDGRFDVEFRESGDGDTRWFHSRGKVMRAEDGSPVRVLGVSQDTSDRHRADAERTALVDAQQRATERAERLQQLSAALTQALTVEETGTALQATCATLPGRPSCRLVLVPPDGAGSRTADAQAGDDSTADAVLEALRTRSALWLGTRDAYRRRYRDDPDGVSAEVGAAGRAGPGDPVPGESCHGSTAPAACAVLPLVSGGTALGAWVLSYAQARTFPPEKRTFLTTAADLVAATLDRVRLFDQQRDVAELLQRSLLPDHLPQVPGTVSAARYLPAGGTAQVGGDWFDVIPLPAGRVGMMIGDVTGHGIAAASRMGHLRSTARAYALQGGGPAQVLTELNQAVAGGQADNETLATVAYAVLDADAGEVRYARAGHLPLVLADCHDGGLAPRLLEDGQGLPLGIDLDTVYGEGSASLRPGSLLLGYTDGLVERRGEDIATGLSRLLDALRGHGPGASLETLLDGVVAEVRGPVVARGQADDVAVVAVALPVQRPAPLHLRVAPDYAQVQVVRERLSRWLRGAGADAETTSGLVLATSEALTSAMEFLAAGTAAHPGHQEVELRAESAGGVLSVSLRSAGWNAPEPDVDRARSLLVMEAVTQGLDVRHTADGVEIRFRQTVVASTP